MTIATDTATGGSVRARAEALLRQLTADPASEFRDGQWEAIAELVERRGRVLVVQRTGWGKSAVYFLTTRLLRDEGAGPTILVSPLLALMRNQIQMAERAGVRAATINSENRDDWDDIERRVDRGEVDLLLISPERLNNVRFRRDVMPSLVKTVGMLVVDEAHCISDWGHDFRPDYRRISRVLARLPDGVPVLCTTATANDRVVADVVTQLGDQLSVQRGPLDRESLALQVTDMPEQAQRLAWLAAAIPTLPGSGIVYTLTVADSKRVAGFLRAQGLDALAYSGETDPDERVRIEEALLANEVKVVVATSALGMGFDKPDLGFVVHYQSPGSPIAYYQQVGRAGRGVPKAVGVLLRGYEDKEIQDHFIRVAFPPRERAEAIVGLLAEREGAPVGITEIEATVNVRRSRIEGMLKVLEVEGAIERADRGWARSDEPWEYPEARVEMVTQLRRDEQAAMEEYAASSRCRMAFLRGELDDPSGADCGRCDRCTGGPVVDVGVDETVVREARRYLRGAVLELEPRRRWPNGLSSPRGAIAKDELVEPGRALSVAGDGGWGRLVESALAGDDDAIAEVVAASAAVIATWTPIPAPMWVTSVPSTTNPAVADVAERLAAALGLPYVAALRRVRERPPQREMENSAQQVKNVFGAFAVDEPLPAGPVLLVDDRADSKWTLTMIGSLLRTVGAPAIHPFVLAKAAGGG